MDVLSDEEGDESPFNSPTSSSASAPITASDLRSPKADSDAVSKPSAPDSDCSTKGVKKESLCEDVYAGGGDMVLTESLTT